MSEPSTASWSQIERTRRDVARRYPSVWSLPVRRRWSDVLLEATEGKTHLLDIGAGDRRLQRLLSEHGRPTKYWSLDIDPEGSHDYRNLESLDRNFDAVCALEWIEHLELHEAEAAMGQIARRLDPGGVVILSTPNTFYPPAFLRDCTHRTPFCYDELGGLLLRHGFELCDVFRLHNAPWLWKVLRRGVLAPMHRMMGIDYARQIIAVGRRG